MNIKNRQDLKYFLDQDQKALKIGKLNWKSQLRQWLWPNEVWRFERTLRYAEYFYNMNYSNLFAKWGG